VKTEPALKEILMNKYNEGVDAINGQLARKDLFFGGGMSKVILQQIPGYVTSGINAPKCINIPALAQAIFNLRTSNQ
jgi:hypothetical protein